MLALLSRLLLDATRRISIGSFRFYFFFRFAHLTTQQTNERNGRSCFFFFYSHSFLLLSLLLFGISASFWCCVRLFLFDSYDLLYFASLNCLIINTFTHIHEIMPHSKNSFFFVDYSSTFLSKFFLRSILQRAFIIYINISLTLSFLLPFTPFIRLSFKHTHNCLTMLIYLRFCFYLVQ